ncbi:putative vacuolar membrane protein [Quercus suber]|uniref:Vacuolar membrane protein n=1 Tax=Quercus suber TaxID=58331 RepID=A0AAW0L0F7_QUESU
MIPDSAQTIGVVFANCFVGSFICDYFWALGVVWTSPLVTALGASLTIPLAMLEDMVIHGRHYSVIYILGSISGIPRICNCQPIGLVLTQARIAIFEFLEEIFHPSLFLGIILFYIFPVIT